MTTFIDIALPVYDDAGVQVDTTTVSLSQEQIEDIINTAVQVVYATRKDATMMTHETMVASPEIAELAEALDSYSVIEPDDYFPGS